MALTKTTRQLSRRIFSSLGTLEFHSQVKSLSVPQKLLKPNLPCINSSVVFWNPQRIVLTSNSACGSIPFPKRSYYSSVHFKENMKTWEENLDPVQKKLLEEECILLDNNDKVIGHDSKKNCHLIRNGDVLLHRAFSVFLFNKKGELLLQQRSKTKITFPLMWTNTCCSHPLYYPDEMDEADAIGIKVAAKRRLEFELGISPDAINLSDFHYLTRIHYKALSNSIWGEHEIDYILFIQKDLEIVPNEDEVKEVRYVSLDHIKKMSHVEGVQLTPWFELIYKSWLPLWWNNLNNLKKFDDHKKIHKM